MRNSLALPHKFKLLLLLELADDYMLLAYGVPHN